MAVRDVPKEEVMRINAAGVGSIQRARRCRRRVLTRGEARRDKSNIDTDGRLVWTRVHRDFPGQATGVSDFRPAGKDFHGRLRKIQSRTKRKLGSARGSSLAIRSHWPNEDTPAGRCATIAQPSRS